jgi:hypothetical protein
MSRGVAQSVTASLTPVPLALRPATDARGPVYRLNAAVEFRNVGGDRAQVAAIDLELLDLDGVGDRQRTTVDVQLPPGGSATYQLSETVPVGAGGSPVRLRMTASALGSEGQLVPVEVEAPVVVVAVPPASAGGPDVTLVGAGDIANCDTPGAEATARLLDSIGGDVLTLGDNVYPNGTTEAFARCYAPTWGRHRYRTHPNPGNHDWDVDAGAPYFAYFGFTAGPAGLGYYSFSLGAWHILSLNSNVRADAGSAQYEWVRRDLASNPAPCTLAYWHHPLFSSGRNGNNGQMRDMWRLLDAAGVEAVLSGHDHLYERFAPQDADGRPTPTGMRAFVVGTGGTHLYHLGSIQPNSELRSNNAWGVLKLTLGGDRYDWQFIPVDGHSFRDVGSATCAS